MMRNYVQRALDHGTGTTFLGQVVIGLEWYHEYRKCQVRWLVKLYIGQTKFSRAVYSNISAGGRR